MRLSPKYISIILSAIVLLLVGFEYAIPQQSTEWIALFNGKTLDGWKASENPEAFFVKDSAIVAHGSRAHLFYVGSVNKHDFKDFEFKADVMTTEGSNSGIYFHTQYQESGWPSQGYEAQINNTFPDDPRRTASLYGIDDIKQSPVKDNEWFTMYIKVEGQQITIKVNGETMVNYTEPDKVNREGTVLSSGTFALQGHDPDSKVYFKNIKVNPL